MTFGANKSADSKRLIPKLTKGSSIIKETSSSFENSFKNCISVSASGALIFIVVELILLTFVVGGAKSRTDSMWATFDKESVAEGISILCFFLFCLTK